ncbi:MAG: hypothetical protein ACM3SW_07495, partial [Actinomycetota bacterium]
MRRPWLFPASLLVVSVISISCLAQSARTPDKSGPPAQSTIQSTTPEPETDSADIPPFARGFVSEEQYLALRDQQIRLQRGINDLVRDPLLRSKAIRSMGQQEFLLHQLRKSAAPLGLLAPAATNSWTPLGPAPIPNGQTDPNLITANELPVSGRVTAIVIDPTDPLANTVYVGT